MNQIGTAILRKDEYLKYANQEHECSRKKIAGWYVENRKSFSNEIDHLVWNCYKKTGEGLTFPIAELSSNMIKKVLMHHDYLTSMGLAWELLHHDPIVSVLRSGNLTIGVPSFVIIANEYENLDDFTLQELRGRIGNTQGMALVPQERMTRRHMNDAISKKQKEIEEKQAAIDHLQEEKKKELERIQLEIEEKYKEKAALIEQKQAEMQTQMKELEKQMFLLDTELYSIRCFLGETVKFLHLCKGALAKETEPVILYQKIRYLDEELGKWLAVYNFDGADMRYFEEILKSREDLRELFAPGPKSVSLIRIARHTIHYSENEFLANTLRAYETYHAKTIGILIRNGDNLWIGWTDEDRISIFDDNAFYKTEKREDKTIDNVYTIVYTEHKEGDDFMHATIQKWGNSQGIRIPKAFLEALGMMENDLVELNRVDDNIVITKVKEKKELTLEEIFKDYDGEYVVEKFDWGSPVGKEVW